jgi:hypothetical protein
LLEAPDKAARILAKDGGWLAAGLTPTSTASSVSESWKQIRYPLAIESEKSHGADNPALSSTEPGSISRHGGPSAYL